jgi:hypothetical protein
MPTITSISGLNLVGVLPFNDGTMKLLLSILLSSFCLLPSSFAADDLAKNFASPPASARPWVYWFWINGNISKEGITADLEAMKRVGIGGVLWMEVSGPAWAPDGKVTPLSPQWHDCMQWALRECKRLGIEFDLTLDFGYGSGGPHITPELSMQKLYWSETQIEGGKTVSLKLEKPQVEKKLSAWLRPGVEFPAKVREQVEKTDSYRDVAVLAIPATTPRAIRDIDKRNGLHWGAPPSPLPTVPAPPLKRVIDLTGKKTWDAPPGKWLVIRFGHASNFKMTRPCPEAAVGLECDRLSKAGIEAHFDAFLKPIITSGKLDYTHIDSWEAGGQNWTATFPDEFRTRRGYDLRPWLPVLTGRVIGSTELTERFLWDMRTTVSELIRDNYARRLRELARTHGVKLSIEAYGHLCIDNLSYAGVSDMPISEFWARGDGQFPTPGGYEPSTKAMASAAHIYGRPVIAAEAFTSDRGWRDHPYLLKAMGDQKFCEGLNRMVFHLYPHQPYANMIPGLTHRRWGEHFHRFNTWWEYSRPWMDYLARCQYLLQQGQFVADVACFFGEGAPLPVNDMKLELPKGYDLDFCSAELVQQMSVKNGRIVLPSGMSYRYLLLPDTDRMTLPLARKIRELAEAGARVIGGKQLKGAPGLTDYPRCDAEVQKINPLISGKTVSDAFAQDGLKPDFEGEGLQYIHRRVGEADVYFVSHQQEEPRDVRCTFRVAGTKPELWDPETGAMYGLPESSVKDGRTSVTLHFDPMQSWFVVFRKGSHPAVRDVLTRSVRSTLPGPWEVQFGPKKVTFDKLHDWSQHADPGIKYYSGTAIYSKVFSLQSSVLSHRICLDLGKVEVMARVKVNGKDCGIAWKPPYRVDISRAVRAGENELEIEVVNLWINRMIGDEQLPLDSDWKDFETLLAWPNWFKTGKPRTSGRYTFTTARHYKKDTPLVPSGLLGPVTIVDMRRSGG